MLIHNRNNNENIQDYYNKQEEERIEAERIEKERLEQERIERETVPDGHLFVTCTDCNGEGQKWYNDYDEDDNDIRELRTCDVCKGKRNLVIGKDMSNYYIEKFLREIPYLQKIVDGVIAIPYEYMIYYAYNNIPCGDCQGRGQWTEEVSPTKRIERTCSTCHGYSTISPSNEEIIEDIRRELEDCKRGMNIYLTSLNNAEYEQEKYAGYEYLIPNPRELVCVKCTLNYDGTNGQGGMDSCNGCVNESGWWESNSTNPNIYFRPHNEEAKKWWNDGGFKNNLVYDETYNYTIK